MRTDRWIAGGLFLAMVHLTVAPAVFSAEETPTSPESFPIQLEFEATDPPRLNQPVTLTLLVKAQPEGWQPAMSGEGRIDLLLRLPIGVRLEGEEWKPVDVPESEKEDPSGPWTLYGWTQPVSVPQSVSEPQVLARVPMTLTVVQEGMNWVIAARATVEFPGQPPVPGNGVLFATVKEDVAEFHTAPKAFLHPSDDKRPPIRRPAPLKTKPDAQKN